MNSYTSSNKLIAKNAVYLYIRMFFSLIVSLYTSRLVLSTLGIEDFGIYNVIGGMVAMFMFINTTMSSATSRFLSYELGKGEDACLSKVFSASLTTHLIIAVGILLLCETIGVWFLENKMVIPFERMPAARLVLQISIITAIINIFQVPFKAIIMAYEQMGIYAYIEILNVVSKLIIVFLLIISSQDKLILYSELYMTTVIVVFLIYVYFSKKKCEGVVFRLSADKTIIKPMLVFSSWDLYGNASVMARTQGVNMLLNMFFGPLLNAANGIANQVQNAVMGFAYNVLSAFKPQIIKSYSSNELARMLDLIFLATKAIIILMLFLMIPLLTEIEFVLTVWLGKWPDYSPILCIYILLFNFVSAISSVVIYGIHATGNIKMSNLINGTLYLLVVPISYLFFKFSNASPVAPFIFNVIAVCIGLLYNIYCLKSFVSGFNACQYLFLLFKCILIGVVVVSFCIFVQSFISEGWFRLFVIIICSVLLTGALSYFILLNSREKGFVKNSICKKIKRQ